MSPAPVKLRADQPDAPLTGLALLRSPFPANQISKLPKPYKKDSPKGKCAECGGYHGLPAVHLDYVGHAALTDRLLDADPTWTWEPVADPASLGLPTAAGGMWIKLTVAGVSRYGFGHPDGKQGGDAVKEVIGDALRNAAMRFGAALDLWHKGDLHAIEAEDEVAEQKAASKAPAPNTTKGAEAPKPPTLAERANRLEAALKAQTTADALRKAYGLASGLCADLDLKDPERLAEIERLYETRFAELSEPAPKEDFGISDDEIPF
ncbi:hypothetical protein [Phenylobacterium sp.]|uniref:hypothetical protein n=1 Tax=Phenylobacterium sp. TaxID=1871053 RepID=UPI0027164ADB|nr:hypothetical protein [Phenylobacterium sp.]MDO8800091.1 hypothetical protein [Phenylobacterium sp.]